MRELKAGDEVLYYPHLDHAMDGGRDRAPIFHWVHVAAVKGRTSVAAGERVDWSKVEPMRQPGEKCPHVREPAESDYSTGARLRGPYGHLMRPGQPKTFWPGRIVVDPLGFRLRALAAIQAKSPIAAEAAKNLPAAALAEICVLGGLSVSIDDPSDGLMLEVQHPNGYETHNKPLSGPNAVTHDPTKQKPHSYHFVEDN